MRRKHLPQAEGLAESAGLPRPGSGVLQSTGLACFVPEHGSESCPWATVVGGSGER
jgi:hypothetical protein